MDNIKFSVTVDKETKEEVEKILKIIGIDMSTAINIYLKKIVHVGGIPFRVCLTDFACKPVSEDE